MKAQGPWEVGREPRSTHLNGSLQSQERSASGSLGFRASQLHQLVFPRKEHVALPAIAAPDASIKISKIQWEIHILHIYSWPSGLLHAQSEFQ